MFCSATSDTLNPIAYTRFLNSELKHITMNDNKKFAGDYNLSQLMVTAAAREVNDEEVVFVKKEGRFGL